MSNSSIENSRKSQAGVVSLMVTMVLMMVITLIVLGFAQVSRREQRQALDRQLSTTAYFAAESGINNAASVIKKALASGGTVLNKTECEPTPEYPASNVLNDADKVSYPCLLVSTQVENIPGDLEAGGQSIHVPLNTAGGADKIRTIHIGWDLASDPANLTGCPASSPTPTALPKTSNWNCPYGMLRVDLVPTSVVTRDGLRTNQRTMFFYPTTDPQVFDYDYNATGLTGSILPMGCTVADGCKLDLTELNGASYSLRLSAIYVGGSFDVTADSASGPVLFSGAQAEIDATGKAQDVLRRVQVRISLSQSGGLPNTDYAIQSGSSLCKRFGYSATDFQIPNDMKQDENNPLCKPITVEPCVPEPRDIVFVLDASNSMLNVWESNTRLFKLQQVTKIFIANSGVSDANNHIAIVQFNEGPSKLLHDFSFDIASLQASVDAMTIKAGTWMDEGMIGAQDRFDNSLLARQGFRQVVVFIGDGEPQPDDHGPPALILADQMQAAGIEVFTVAIQKEQNPSNSLYEMASDPKSDYYANAEYEQELETILENISGTFACE